jgi:hypothetical protein
MKATHAPQAKHAEASQRLPHRSSAAPPDESASTDLNSVVDNSRIRFAREDADRRRADAFFAEVLRGVPQRG